MGKTSLAQDLLMLLSPSKKHFSSNNSLPFSAASFYAHSSLETFLAVNFKEVIKNAKEQGVDLQEIAIFYEGLTDEEIKLLGNHQLITHTSGSTTIAKFPKSGLPIIQSKATGVHYLGA